MERNVRRFEAAAWGGAACLTLAEQLRRRLSKTMTEKMVRANYKDMAIPRFRHRTFREPNIIVIKANLNYLDRLN